jgi:ankyrin repeat protein
VHCLLEVQADVNQVDNAGRTALMLALGEELGVPGLRRIVEYGDFDEQMVRLLVDARADVLKVDNEGNTVMQFGVYFRDSLFDILAQAGVGLDQESNVRWQAQIAAARVRKSEYVQECKARAERYRYSCAE